MAREQVFKRGLATLLLIRADYGHYGIMKNQVQQNMAMGTNNYPKSGDDTMNTLNTCAKMNKIRFGKNSFKEVITITKLPLLRKASVK